MQTTIWLLRRDMIILCFLFSAAFVGFWSTILYHNIQAIGTNTVVLLTDTFVTEFIVCIASAISTGIMIRRTFRGKKLPSIKKDERFWNLFPGKPWSFGFVMGVYFSIVLSLVFDGTYGFFNWNQLTLTQFVLIKMAYSGLLGALAAYFTIQRMMPAKSNKPTESK